MNCGINIEMRIKEAIQELPADEILLHEAVLIADALGKDIKDLFVVETVTII